MNENVSEAPKKKHGGIIAVIVLLAIFFIASGGKSDEKAPKATEPNIVQQETSAPAEPDEPFTIVISAEEKGEYGELIELNKGTELEESYYVYRVPAGTYTVTLTGKYMDQFNVYGETVYTNEDGWEQLSDVYYVKLFQPNESDTVTIEDGQIIEIHGSGVWELKLN